MRRWKIKWLMDAGTVFPHKMTEGFISERGKGRIIWGQEGRHKGFRQMLEKVEEGAVQREDF